MMRLSTVRLVFIPRFVLGFGLPLVYSINGLITLFPVFLAFRQQIPTHILDFLTRFDIEVSPLDYVGINLSRLGTLTSLCLCGEHVRFRALLNELTIWSSVLVIAHLVVDFRSEPYLM